MLSHFFECSVFHGAFYSLCQIDLHCGLAPAASHGVQALFTKGDKRLSTSVFSSVTQVTECLPNMHIRNIYDSMHIKWLSLLNIYDSQIK